MKHKDFIIAENSFYKYQMYEKEAREDIKTFIENELLDVVVEANYHNMLELKISGDKYYLYTERGYLILHKDGNPETQEKMYFESIDECLEFLGIDTKEW